MIFKTDIIDFKLIKPDICTICNNNIRINLKYQSKPLLFKTPKLTTIFGYNNLYNSNMVNFKIFLSSVDKSNEEFKIFINRLDKHIKSNIKYYFQTMSKSYNNVNYSNSIISHKQNMFINVFIDEYTNIFNEDNIKIDKQDIT